MSCYKFPLIFQERRERERERLKIQDNIVFTLNPERTAF